MEEKNAEQQEEYNCPHCGEKMKKWDPPDCSTWAGCLYYLCMNDECPYYVKGWNLTLKQRNAHGSYRNRYNPRTGKSGPQPVSSPEDFKMDTYD